MGIWYTQVMQGFWLFTLALKVQRLGLVGFRVSVFYKGLIRGKDLRGGFKVL